jgi:putative glutathione S-transferase
MWNNAQGEFVRYQSGFRDWVRADGSTRFSPEAGRYHLYVSLACPWAHRTLIARALLGLEEAISVSIVEPVWNENGWYFSSRLPDLANGQPDLVSVYRLADPDFAGEESTPLLWDSRHRTIVNNESREILRMLDHEFSALGNGRDLCPPDLARRVDEVLTALYEPINNGVYRAGFATRQAAYERAVTEVFAGLDRWERELSGRRYLCGDILTEADIAFFTTLLRFDPVYHGHFKCNLKRIEDYPNLRGYLRDVFQVPGVAATCDLDHIKRHYYATHASINPTGIVPLGPILDLTTPHGRSSLDARLTR